ncbi:hypothetical protein ACFXHA_44965 [Nocardia sp. NPDC059240]|uniref:hypothetical protein n=1 Tax=Nocardia sp. NPDC059240 TaxID=3346786 RepID=UPI0036ACE9EE
MSYPHNQFGQQRYPAPAPPPNNATAVLAATFGLCLGVWFTMGTFATYSIWSDDEKFRSLFASEPQLIFRPLAAMLLVAGGILLLRRLTVGRVFVIVGVLAVFGDAFADPTLRIVHGIADLIFPVAFFAFYLAIVVLAAHPATGRWIRTRTYA